MASGPIISWQIGREKAETIADFIFLGFKITANGDWSHEIKRCLLLGREVVINIDSILNSRDITLPIKLSIVKAMVFLAVMYECKSWTIKKADCWRIDVFELCWRRLLRIPWEEIKSVNPKGNQCWIFLEGLVLNLKLQYFGYLMWRVNSFGKTLIWERLKAKVEEGDGEWDG